MKTKIKRHYRSAVSVLLSVCMLISCMTVGLIATDAAKVTADEAVGGASDTFWQYQTIFFKTDGWGNDSAHIKVEMYPDMHVAGTKLGEVWMTRVNANLYLFTIPYNNCKSFKIHRYNPNNHDESWSNVTPVFNSNANYRYYKGDEGWDTNTRAENYINVIRQKSDGGFNKVYWADYYYDGDGSTSALWLWKPNLYNVISVPITALNTEDTFTVSETADYYWAFQYAGKLYHIAGGGAGHVSDSELNNYTVSNKEAKCYMNNQQDVKEDKNNFQTGSTYAIKVINAGDEKSTHQLYKVRPTATLDVGNISNANATVVQGDSTYNVNTTGNTVYQSTDTTVTVTPADGYDLPEGAQISVGGSSYALTKSGGSYTATFQLSGDATGANGLTFPTPIPVVASSLTLTASDGTTTTSEELIVDSSTTNITLTATAIGSTGAVTYTFQDVGGTTVGTAQTSSDGSASVTMTQSEYQKIYKVIASQTDHASVTSNTVSVINSSSDTPPTLLFGIYGALGQYNSGSNNQGWGCTTFANSLKNFKWVSGNVFRMEVKLAGNTDGKTAHPDNNKFRLINSSNEKWFAPNANGQNLTVSEYSADIGVANKHDSSTDDHFNTWFVDDNDRNNYYLYLDQTDADHPKVWFTPKGTGSVYVSNKGKTIVTDGTYISDANLSKLQAPSNTSTMEYPFTQAGDAIILNNGEAIKSDYNFILSDQNTVKVNFDEYSIDTKKNIGVTVSTKTVRLGTNPETSAGTVQVFTVKSNAVTKDGTTYYTENVVLHIDSTNKKLWVTSDFDQKNASTKTSSYQSKTVRYYFAQAVSQDKSGDNDKIENGIKLYYWNNSLSGGASHGLRGEQTITTSDTETTGYGYLGKIKVDLSGTVGNMTDNDASFNPGLSSAEECNLYYIDLPIGVTTARFKTNSNGDINREIQALNPNRVYLLLGTGDTCKVTSVVLDKSLWTNTPLSTLNSSTKTFKANIVKVDDSNDNADLNTAYNNLKIQHALYFGLFHQKSDGFKYHFKRADNLAQRGGTGEGAPNERALHAITWGLAGNMLNMADTTTNPITGDYYSLYDKEYRAIFPFADYSNANTTSVASQMATDTNFPFYSSEYHGITTYSYDSLADPNRVYKNDSGKTYSKNTYKHIDGYNGYAPWGDGNEYATLSEFDVSFYMTPTGTNIGYDYNDDGNVNTTYTEDIVYNFSGDDDVWVYVDGVKVLDLGGDHKISAGVINFTDMKVYYKTPAEDTNYISNTDASYADKMSAMYTIDLDLLMKAYGKTFDPTDPAPKHTLQMFYMERGRGQSNFSASFNLPQNSGLRIENDLDTSNVNPGLLTEVQNVANNDYFSYSIAQSTASDGDISTAAIGWDTLKGTSGTTLHTAASSAISVRKDPYYPANLTENAVRSVNGNDKTLMPIGLTGGVGSADNTLTDSTFNVNGLTYKLLDAFQPAKVSPSGKVDDDGKINLLFDEVASFEKKMTPNTILAIAQEDALYDTAVDSNGCITKSAAAKTGRTVKDYYKTTYKVTDDSTETVIADTTASPAYNTGNTKVSALGLTDKFYFTDYSVNSENAAMTVEFKNQPATGSFTITKNYTKLDTEADPNDIFYFEVKFTNVFGGTSAAAEYPDLKYTVNGVEKTYETDGIALKVGQTATISGVPVGTSYTVKEKASTRFQVESTSTTCTIESAKATLNAETYTYSASLPKLAAGTEYAATYIYNNTLKTIDVVITKTIDAPYDGYVVEDFATEFGIKIYKQTNGQGAFTEITDSLKFQPHQESDTRTEIEYDNSVAAQCYKIKPGDLITLKNQSPEDVFKIVETHSTGKWNASDLDYYKYNNTVLTKLDETAATSTSLDDANGIQFTLGNDSLKANIHNLPEMKTVTIKKNTDFVEEGSLFNIIVAMNQHNGTGFKANLAGTFTAVDPQLENNPSEVTYESVQYGRYKSKKDSVITFSVPIGARLMINELAADSSPVTGSIRFKLNSDASKALTYKENDSSTPTTTHALTVGSDKTIQYNTDFVVDNEIIKNDIVIEKYITNRGTGAIDSTTEHFITVLMKNNGENGADGIASTRYNSLSYTITHADNSTNTYTNIAYNYPVASPNIHRIAFKEHDQITFHMPIGTYVEVEEIEVGGDYEFAADKNITVSNVASYADATHKAMFTTTNQKAIVNVNNKRKITDVKYRIEYDYPSRSQFVKTNSSDGSETIAAGSPMYGRQQFFKEGILTSDNEHFADYFDLTANENKGGLKKAFVVAVAPYENNFMQDLTWAESDVDESSLKAEEQADGTFIYTAKASVSRAAVIEKKVQFLFPYNYEKVEKRSGWAPTYIPQSYDDAAYLGNDEDIWKKTGTGEGGPDKVTYQGEFIDWEETEETVIDPETGESKTETVKHYYHTCAPSTLKTESGTSNFLYWSIRSKNRFTGEYVEVARSYYEIFNYVIFDDYLIIPVYDCFDSSKYDITTDSSSSTSAKFAKINLLQYSRNQWNSNVWGDTIVRGNGTFTTAAGYEDGRDTVYADFDISFGYDNVLLKKSNTLQAGILIENCGKLDPEHPLNLDDTAVVTVDGVEMTKYQADYKYYIDRYRTAMTDIRTNLTKNLQDNSEMTDALYAAYVKSLKDSENLPLGKFTDDITDDKVLRKVVVSKALNNKNRAELAVSHFVRAIGEEGIEDVADWTIDEVSRDSLFRAYTYVKDTSSNTIVLSEPAYFTVYNTSRK